MNLRFIKQLWLTKLNPGKSIFSLFLLLCLGSLLLSGCSLEFTGGVLNPKGIVTFEQRILLFDSVALMLIVVLPVIIMSFAFVYKFHRSRTASEYKPNWSHSLFLEGLWWGIPIVIVVLLGILAWNSSHNLDPYRPIDNRKVDLRINVISLPWKWLFIYPDQHIATVNELVIPKNKQVEFWITSDNAAMCDFFVPQLSSQIFAMAGMRTKLHMIATTEGTYRGVNAQYNGDGFSDMHFPVRVVNDEQMAEFITKAQSSSGNLSMETYKALREPSKDNPAQYFSNVTPELFQRVIAFYMANQPLDSAVALHTSQCHMHK